MNKIYTNLTIENLIKTDWFDQFDKEQQEEILEGLKNNIDVLIYAKKEFDSEQMFAIRLGLEDNSDVSIYAKKEFNWKQMEEIREKLRNEQNI